MALLNYSEDQYQTDLSICEIVCSTVYIHPRVLNCDKGEPDEASNPHSPNRFKLVSYSGAIPFVTKEYAVINNAAMPIIGEWDG